MAGRRRVNWEDVRNWFWEQNLFGQGATLRDVARHFDLGLDPVKKRSAAERWSEELKARQACPLRGPGRRRSRYDDMRNGYSTSSSFDWDT